MQSVTQTAPASKKMLWTGRILSAVPILLLLFSGVMKVMKPAPVVQGFARYGYPEDLILLLGLLEILSCIVYLIPRTSILGAWVSYAVISPLSYPNRPRSWTSAPAMVCLRSCFPSAVRISPWKEWMCSPGQRRTFLCGCLMANLSRTPTKASTWCFLSMCCTTQLIP